MHLNGAANHPVGEGIKDHLNLLTRSAKSAKKESICPLWADLVPTSRSSRPSWLKFVICSFVILVGALPRCVRAKMRALFFRGTRG
jgi:hypothetical protein